MSKHLWFPPPEPEPPEDLSLKDFLVEILGYFYNVLLALTLLLIVLATCAIVLFLISATVALIAKLVVGIANPIPFIHQF